MIAQIEKAADASNIRSHHENEQTDYCTDANRSAMMKRLGLFLWRSARFCSISSAIWLDQYDHPKGGR